MKRRFAIPVNSNLLSEHFGACEAFAFVDVEDGRIVQVQVLKAPDHARGSYPAFVVAHGATDLIAGSMGSHAISMLKNAQINVYLGAPVRAPEQLVRDFLDGKLELSDNCCDHDHHDHHHGPGHHGHHHH